MNIWKEYRYECIGAVVCLVSSMLIGDLFMPIRPSEWYQGLVKPSFNPPSYVFGPVWTVLYLMMGVVLGRLWEDRQKKGDLLVLFGVQFLLNVCWTPLFFYLQRIDLALWNLTGLSLVVWGLVYQAWNYRQAGLWLTPYALWLSYAWLLNLNLYLLN